MLKVAVKPYASISIPNRPLPFPISQQHPTVCAKRQGWSQPSNGKLLQLASTVAFNLKILPEPLNSLAGEIARGGCRPLADITGYRRPRTKKPVWLALALVCVAGLWSWRVREFEVFVRASSFCLAGISFLRLWWLGKKAVKEWLFGFFFGILLAFSFRFGKEDANFWVQRLLTSSPVKQILISGRNRYRNRNRRMFKFK
ncbi:hypothetical protein Fmac_024549 [Flemingia macrophylla]|uniref:Uncharacterized protein n=1 Tax=Flemingia macrophylla TaxID=520843 RepID=A0ABD1LPT5_9FABA